MIKFHESGSNSQPLNLPLDSLLTALRGHVVGVEFIKAH